MPESLKKEDLRIAFDDYVAKRVELDHLDYLAHMVVGAGGEESLSAVRDASLEFTLQNPNAFNNHFESPTLAALRAGILIGHSLALGPTLPQ